MELNPKMAKWAAALPLTAVFIWSLNIAVTRYVAEFISPVSISFYRWLIAFALLTPFMLPQLLRQRALVLSRLRALGVDVIEAPHDRIGTRLIDAYLAIKRKGAIG